MTYAKTSLIILLAAAALILFGWASKADAPGDYEEEAVQVIKQAEAATSTPPTQAQAVQDEPKQAQVRKVSYPVDEPRREASEAAYAKVKQYGTDDPEEWLLALEWCESRGYAGAINPKDRDGTPSNGLLQFKDTTFAFFSKAYGIPGELMDPDAQRAIVMRMMSDPSIIWENQFPDCVQKHIGKPPILQ